MSVSLRQLRAFVSIAQVGSFVQAARAMHVTAPALSILISELEQSLGFRVLDRTTRKVKVSAAGELYFPYAQRVLVDLDIAARIAQDLRSQKSGMVRIATSQLIAWTLMPAVFSSFRAFRPDIRLEPYDLGVDQILPALESGRADLGVTLHSSAIDAQLQSLPLFQSRVHVVCPAQHPFARRRRVRWEELADEPLIFTGTDTPERINAALPAGSLLQAAHQVEHTGTALSLAASAFGSAVCAGYVKPMTTMHDLAMIPLVEPTVVRQFAVYNRRLAMTPAVEGFRDFLVQHFAASAGRFVEETMLRSRVS
jgi:DNA-binding transcriptional LysR family regulator